MNNITLKPTLTVENLSSLFNKEIDCFENFNKNFTLQNYNECVKFLLNYFFTGEILSSFYINRDNIKGGYFYSNLKFVNKFVKNCDVIEFTSLYPNIISKLQKSGDIEFSNKNFGVLYSFIVDNYIELKQNLNISKKEFLKRFINFTFGAMCNNSSIVNAKNIEIVPVYTKKIFDDIKEDKNNIIRIDVDVIYLKTISIDILKKLSELNLDYTSKNESIIFLDYRRIIVTDENCKQIIKTEGIKK